MGKIPLAEAYQNKKCKSVSDIKWVQRGDSVMFTTTIKEQGRIIRNRMGIQTTRDHELYGKVLDIAERDDMFQVQVEIYNTSSDNDRLTTFTAKTKVKKGTREPEWNETFPVNEPVSDIKSIEFVLWDWDAAVKLTGFTGDNELIGSTTMWSDIDEDWNPLQTAGTKTLEREIEFEIKDKTKRDKAESNGTVKLTVALKVEKKNGAMKLTEIEVVDATNVPAMDIGGSCDPMVEVKVNTKKYAPRNSYGKSTWVPLDRVELDQDLSIETITEKSLHSIIKRKLAKNNLEGLIDALVAKRWWAPQARETKCLMSDITSYIM